MGCSVSAYYDDMHEYRQLCKKYQEEPELDFMGGADPYSDHARRLRERERSEKQQVSPKPQAVNETFLSFQKIVIEDFCKYLKETWRLGLDDQMKEYFKQLGDKNV